ncbi:MAG: 2-oxoacid:acceptor oxidoreductase subunit alpha [Deltaproteobacteria bacterium]|nr:2-oxoacid:acceptor oxidoreductase subunit alpha [Deltaproteobacteria bacterium]
MTQAHNPPVADPSHKHSSKHRTDVESAVIRFSGDSGDGMQLTGTQFSNTSATLGNDLATFPDFPAEIRAPAGTTFGVSGFQVNLAARDVYTPGDEPDVLVAMNPAALKVNLPDLKMGGLLIINRDAFTKANIERAGYDHNPLEDGSLARYRLVTVDVTTQVETALRDLGLSFKEVARAKNFWTLGLIYYLYSRPLEPTLRYIESKFSAKPVIAEGNRIALKAGYLYGENAEIIEEVYQIGPAKLAPGLYRTINGNQAAAWGALVAAKKSGVPLFYGSYPITPASDILHELSHFKSFGVSTFQAEDEIAAIGATIGAAFAGQLAITGSSGPGIALKSEAIGLAVGVELPLVIINVQRGGPSTGLPTKTEQADLYQALFGRNGECPVAVIAAATPSDCFQMTFEACRIALKYMTPIFVLTDGYLANGSEPWMIPKLESLPAIPTKFWTEKNGFQPFMRDPKTLARVWAVPGTPGLEHRIGGLEKDFNSGHISYDPENHERMIHVRQDKIDNIAQDIPDLDVFGAEKGGKLLVLSWGSTFGSVRQAVQTARAQGLDVSHAQLRYLNPLPKNTEEVLRRFDKVLVPELNLGQLAFYLRGKFLLPVIGLNKIQGKPFRVDEILDRINQLLGK